MIEDLYIDSVTGDLALDDAGNLLFVEGAARVRQQLEARLDMQRGSWFRDTSVGVDWIGEVLGVSSQTDSSKQRELRTRAAVVREALLVPDVAQIARVDVVLDASQILQIDFDARTSDGTLVGGTLT